MIYGGIRDAEQIVDIENLATYCRGFDPTAIRDVTLTGINVPCRIGDATCMPGDVVLGTMTGVLFIPPHEDHQFHNTGADVMRFIDVVMFPVILSK